MATIYLITNKQNGKVYVGQAVRPIEKRWSQHLCCAKRGSHFYLHRAIRKYGSSSFEMSVLHFGVETKEELDRLEKLEIVNFRSSDQRFGYNRTEGGEGPNGLNVSDEARRKMSEKAKVRVPTENQLQALRTHHAEAIQKSAELRRGKPSSKRGTRVVGLALKNVRMAAMARRGVKLTEEHKRKVGLGLTGHRHTEESKRKMSRWRTNLYTVERMCRAFGIFLLFVFIVVPAKGQGIATISGNLKNLGVQNVTQQNAYVQFTLYNYGSTIPRVISTNAIVSKESPPLTPDVNGNINGSLQENVSITPANTFYRMCVFYQGVQFECDNYLINANFNIESGIPLMSTPPPVNPILTTLVDQICQSTTPPIPPTGNDVLYCLASDNNYYFEDSTGRVVGPLGSGGGGGGVSLSTDNTWTNNNRFKGPIPFADITTFGARPILGSSPVQTVSCATSNTITFGADPLTLGFQVKDGITIYGCGPTNTMSTPGTVTVVPSEAAGETGTGWVVNSPTTGGASYQYCIFARDKFGAVTPCSATASISNGEPTLGLQRVNISSLTRSNDQVTVVTAANQLAAIAAVQIESTASLAFNGWFSVGSITNGTTFVLNSTPNDTRAQGWQAGDVASVGSGGSVAYYLGNHLTWTLSTGAWEYYVCAKRPGDGALHLIGVTKPSSSPGYQDVEFDDWGSPYMDSQTYPAYITNTNCTGSATNDPLTSTITAINSGAHTATLANSANQTLGSTTAIFDDGPALLAAANSVVSGGNGGTVYIPPATTSGAAYFINSYTKLPSTINIWQSGYLADTETIEVDTAVNWYGDWGSAGVPQFGYNSGSGMQIAGSYPGIYIHGFGNTFRGLNLYTAGLVTNGGMLIVGDDINGTNFSHMNFVTANNSGVGDYLSTAVLIRDTSGSVDNFDFDTILFSCGPDQVSDKSWSPCFAMAPRQDGSGNFGTVGYFLHMSNIYWNRRGMSLYTTGGAGLFEFDNMYRQGGITPMFAFESGNICTGCGNFIFTNEIHDTEGEPVLADLDFTATGVGTLGVTVVLNNVNGSSVNGPLISGTRPQSTVSNGTNFLNALSKPNRDLSNNEVVNNLTYYPYATTGTYVPIQGALQTFAEPVHIPSQHSFYFDLAQPTGVTSATSGAGSVPASAWYYAVNATGADGGETILSVPAAPLTPSGAQGVLVSWTPAVGAYSYNIYRCTTSCLTADGNASTGVTWVRVAQHQTGTSYTDTAASGTAVIVPKATGTGVAIGNLNGWFGPLFQCPLTSSAPSTVSGAAILYCGATRFKMNNGGTVDTVAGLGDFAAPPAIGNTTPAAGSFTTGSFTGGLTTNITGGGTQCVHVSNAGLESGTGADCGSGGGGANAQLTNISATAVSASLIPGAVNTDALGSTSFPWTNSFIGPSATGYFTWGNLGSLTAGRTANVPNANSTLVQSCPAVVNQFMTAISQATGACSQSLINATASSVPSYVADSGSSTVYVATLASAITAYAPGLTVRFLPANANTSTTPTLNVNGVGAATITKFGTVALSLNDLITTAVAEVIYDGTDWELQNPATFSTALTSSSTNTLTNKTVDAEGTGNAVSEPITAHFVAAGCSAGSTAAPSLVTGSTNTPNPQCIGSTVPKAVLQFAHGNIAYISSFQVPRDYNSGHNTDIEICANTTDTTNGHTIIWDVQTGFNKVDGTVTDDPALNAQQQLTVTIGASQVSGGELCGTLTAMTMTGSSPSYNFEVQIKRDAADTDTDTAVAMKYVEITIPVTRNAANR